MYSQEEFNLVAQYYPEDLNEFTTRVAVSSVLDAASWGVVRSVVKTPSAVVRLMPGQDPGWTNSYDSTVNKAINARSIGENIFQPTWNFVTSPFKK